MKQKEVLQASALLSDVSSSSRQPIVSSWRILRFMQQHPVVCYFLLAYGLSWLGWLPYVLSQSGLGLLPFALSQVSVIPGAFLGPCFSGFLMTAVTEGKSGVRQLWRRMIMWRVGWQWYLFALVGAPVLLILGTLALPGAGAALHAPTLQALAIYLPFVILEILTTGLAEEPGWRGFALPRLQQRYGPLVGTLLLGLLWGGWHLPLFLTSWAAGGTSWPTICLFVLAAMSLGIVLTWVFNRTRGSVFIAIVLHSNVDAFTSVIWLNLFPTFMKQGYLAMLIGVGGMALLLIVVTRGRLGYPQMKS